MAVTYRNDDFVLQVLNSSFPRSSVGMQPLTLQRLHRQTTLERCQTHSHAERGNDNVAGVR